MASTMVVNGEVVVRRKNGSEYISIEMLNQLGPRWEAGEKLSVLAKEAGTNWQYLQSLLLRQGFKTAGNRNETGAVDIEAIRQIVRDEMAQTRPAAQMIEIKLPDGKV